MVWVMDEDDLKRAREILDQEIEALSDEDKLTLMRLEYTLAGRPFEVRYKLAAILRTKVNLDR